MLSLDYEQFCATILAHSTNVTASQKPLDQICIIDKLQETIAVTQKERYDAKMDLEAQISVLWSVLNCVKSSKDRTTSLLESLSKLSHVPMAKLRKAYDPKRAFNIHDFQLRVLKVPYSILYNNSILPIHSYVTISNSL